MRSRHILALVLVAGLAAGIGANPRFIEELKIGGGFDEPTDGGADFDANGDIATTGTVTSGDAKVTGITLGGAGITPRLHVQTATGGSGAKSILHGRNDGNTPLDSPNYLFYRSRGTNGSETAVQAGDELGEIFALGHDGNDYEAAAVLRFLSSAEPGIDNMPGGIEIYTTPDGSRTPALRLRLDHTGRFDFQSHVLSDLFLDDASAHFADDIDGTKRAAFELAGLTPGASRTLTLPDQNLDLTPGSGSFQSSGAGITEIANVSPDKGDVLVYDGSNWVDLGVGSDDQVIVADSTESNGLRWATNTPGSGASQALDNLASVAVNESLISDTDELDDLGSASLRWQNFYAVNARTGQGAGQKLTLEMYDVDGAAYVDAVTLTANNEPTIDLNSGATIGGNTIANLATAQEYTQAQNFNATDLTDGANISWDMAANQVTEVTLGGDRTLDNPTNAVDGATGWVIVKQDGTGGHTLSFDTAYDFPNGGTAPTITSAANSVDVLMYIVDGSNILIFTTQDFQ